MTRWRAAGRMGPTLPCTISLLLIICSVLPFLYADQDSDAARNSSISFEPGQSVIGVAQRSNLLAFFVVDTSGADTPGLISVYEDGKAGITRSLYQIPVKGLKRDAMLLEFQFGGASSLFFCTSSECGICHFPQPEDLFSSAHCQQFPLGALDRSGFKVLKGSYSAELKRLFLRGIGAGSANASTYLVAINDTTNDSQPSIQFIGLAADLEKAFSEHELVSSFTFGDHVFFVGSATRTDVPYKIMSGAGMVKRMDVRLTRICLRDKTPLLESKLDLTLSCNGLDNGAREAPNPHRALAASISSDGRRLLVAMLNGTSNKVVCEYDMDSLKAAFDDVWDTCQNIDNSEAVADRCNADGTIYKECNLISWTRNIKRPICQRFSSGASVFKLANCNLSSVTSTMNRNGWIENFDFTMGEIVAVFNHSAAPNIAAVAESPNSQKALFITFVGGMVERRIKKAVADPSPPLWSLMTTPLPLQATPTNLYYVTSNESNVVKSYGLDCNGLYSTCPVIPWADPLNCGWCVDVHGRGYAFEFDSTEQCPTGVGQQLQGVCPPRLTGLLASLQNRTIVLFGEGLYKLQEPTVKFCGQDCKVIGHKNDVLTCQRPNEPTQPTYTTNESTGKKEAVCNAVLTGKLGEYDGFTAIYNHVDKPSELKDGGGSGSHTWIIRAVVAVVVIILLIVTLWVLHGCYEKYSNRINDKASHHYNGAKGANLHQRPFRPFDPSYKSLLSSNVEQPVFGSADEMRDYPFGRPPSILNGEFSRAVMSQLRSDQVHFMRPIGEGHSSKVHLAVLRRSANSGGEEEERYVAVKTVTNSDFNSEDVLREIELISRCRHENIVEYVGQYTTGFGVHIVTEYMAGGDLHKFLVTENNRLTIGNAFTWIMNICEGMNYLTHCHIVHRDLAARNCMLDETNTIVKITDFGLCRVSNRDYEYVSANNNQQLPFRWTALECFGSESKFSEKSDIWSFGVVMWEIFARNLVPYEGIADSTTLREFLRSGGRLPHIQPELTPKELYEDVMLRCWDETPANRPTFNELRQKVLNIYFYLASQRPDDLSTEYETPNRTSTSPPATAENDTTSTAEEQIR